MPRAISCLILALGLGLYAIAPVRADAIPINRIAGNGGSVETAHLSVHDGKIYVTGRVKLQNLSSGSVSVRIDLKDAEGRIIASDTSRSYPSGRRQTIATFGVSYVGSFDAAQAKDVASVDVTYLD